MDEQDSDQVITSFRNLSITDPFPPIAKKIQRVMKQQNTLKWMTHTNSGTKGKLKRRLSVSIDGLTNSLKPLVNNNGDKMEPVRKVFSMEYYEQSNPPNLVFLPTFEVFLKLMRVCIGIEDVTKLTDCVY
jgi:hypothetical protein